MLRVNSAECQCCRKERLLIELMVSARSAKPENLGVQRTLQLTLCSKFVFCHPKLNLCGFIFFLVVFAFSLEAGSCRLAQSQVQALANAKECFSLLPLLTVTMGSMSTLPVFKI